MLVDVSVGADGFDDGFRGHADLRDVLDDVLEGDADASGAPLMQAGGNGVVVEGARVEIKLFGDPFRAVPVDEKILDDFAVPVTADGALAAMARSSGRRGECGRGEEIL